MNRVREALSHIWKTWLPYDELVYLLMIGHILWLRHVDNAEIT